MTHRLVLVTGSRNWTNEQPVHEVLNEELRIYGKTDHVNESGLVVIHGAARGLDTIVARWCSANRVKQLQYPAQWRRYGKAAGILRNEEMVKLNPHICYAWPMSDSRGTRHCMAYAESHGIHVVNKGAMRHV